MKAPITMSTFPLHTEDSAPEAARPLLEKARKTYGMQPNLFRGLAESPAALAAYFDLGERMGQSGLSAQEQQILFLSVSFENSCAFCMAAHTGGGKASGLSQLTLDALRDGEALPDAKQNALATFARAVVRERGFVSNEAVQSFLDAGYTKANVLDVILGVSMKTLSNYANHILETPLNDELAPLAWKKPATV